MLVREALAWGRDYLRKYNLSSPELDARVLLGHVTGLSRTKLIVESESPLSEEQEALYHALLERRAAGEPVAYLIGGKEFMGLNFKVSPAVLIPRPDTELLVETAVYLLNRCRDPLAVDVGTGSGAIAVSLATFVPNAQIKAIDISPEALAVAEANTRLRGVEQRVTFHLGSLLEPLPPALHGKIDVITANLPYIPTGDISGLMADVKDYEPHLALDGGPDGLDLYRLLLPQARQFLKTGGFLLMEIGPGQGQAALDMLAPDQWQSKLYYDLAQRERLVVATKIGSPSTPTTE